jgi:hypothetical protein
MASAHQYGAGLEAPPPESPYVYAHAEKPFSSRIVGHDYLELTLPESYEFS